MNSVNDRSRDKSDRQYMMGCGPLQRFVDTYEPAWDSARDRLVPNW